MPLARAKRSCPAIKRNPLWRGPHLPRTSASGPGKTAQKHSNYSSDLSGCRRAPTLMKGESRGLVSDTG
jgi:hypothetical protein